ncbi:ATP-binding cassette domain-containing protein [Oenococcus kitaharae]|uniref:ABC-type cobalt transport system ATPase component n=1 Tax=Oenococcus kitaharae DSM 17330 TaxID=1045004 RepID=G9WFB9_9LACO|nr:ATP-binding cassette domain-containing protein [Oenococcus kitaharae]EHN58839.1 ABC-type cobalt transport system ATPase component [Oenococcus kitaharae DSM 17330]
MIQIKNLTFSYGHQIILKNLNITFSATKLNMLIGPNGAGKTTLLDIIAGLYDREKPHLDKTHIPSHNQIAYSLQNPIYFPTLTVQQTLNMYQEIDHAGGQTASMVMQQIQQRVFKKNEDTKVGQLSGGERKLLLTCGTCLLKRDLYLFDEPLSGVDPVNCKYIMQLIASLVTEQKKQVIFTNHQFNALSALPIQVIGLNHGTCVLNADYADFINTSENQSANEAFQKMLLS